LLNLKGNPLWVLRIGLGVLGITAAGVLVWFFLKEKAEPEAPPAGGDEIDVAIATARARLHSARYAEKARLGDLPLILCLGPVGSAKTTTIVRSGLEPELLAGEVFRGEAVAATRAINLWYGSKTVLLEAGGKVVGDPARWSRLVRHLTPSRWSAALRGRAQASRMAIVCFSCEEMLKPGGGEAVMAAARDLRARLSEVSQRLGIRLPVYVVFTKADRIPYFPDYVRNFSSEEARDVLGVTLPWDNGPAGSYADRIFQRLTHSMGRIYGSLASRRLMYMPRETQPETLAAAYEFPREFRKISQLATQFMTDLCKPSQLEVSPMLRGFYFSGVRAVIVNDAGSAPAPEARAVDPRRMEATQAFVPSMAPQAPVAPRPAGGGQRKVPQWLFLEHLFREVILRDRVAMGATAGGARVNLLRRVLLVSAAAVALVLALGLMVSFVANRHLESRLIGAARSLTGATSNAPDLPTIEVLRRLDSLRTEVATLAEYEREGAPLRLRWGLYSGSNLFPEARTLYFKAFDNLMFGATREAMLRNMANLPATPNEGSEYQGTYDLLKAYLITTAYPEQSTPDFLTPVLLGNWQDNRQVDDARLQLAQQQFAFYAQELKYGNPYTIEANAATVDHARGFLRQFTGSQRIYQFMLAEAAKKNPAFQFTKAFPASAAVLTSTYEVPGAFTKGGWEFMQEAFKNVDRYFEGESWVLGDKGPSAADKAKVVDELRAQYRADYLKHWRAFLAGARVAGFATAQDGAQKLAVLSGNQSPLLQIFQVVAKNTAVDSTFAATAFQPVQVLTPAGADKLIGESNQGFMSNLVALQASLEQAGSASAGSGDAAVQKAVGDAGTAKVTARQLAQKFSTDPSSVGPDVLRLMIDPLSNVERLLSNFGAAGLNKSGRDFCRPLQRLMTVAPFKPGAPSQASLADVSSQFQRGTGAIWSYYNDVLQKYLVQQGARYAPRPGADIPLNPSFVEFFNRSAAFSDALYPQSPPPGPRVAFTFKPLLSDLVTSVTVSIDGRTATFTRTSTAAYPFQWIGTEARDARLTAQVGGNEVTMSYKGTWAVFQLFQAAENWRVEGIVQRAQWSTKHQGAQVTIPFELNLGGAPPIFDPGYFAGASCSGQVAR
jgi:type VI secretion system protein ImpL